MTPVTLTISVCCGNSLLIFYNCENAYVHMLMSVGNLYFNTYLMHSEVGFHCALTVDNIVKKFGWNFIELLQVVLEEAMGALH